MPRCLFPITIFNKRYQYLNSREKCEIARELFHRDTLPDEYISVPCGHCDYCIKRKQSEWAFRLVYEMRSYSQNAFLTLTFKDEYLDTMDNKEIRKCIRRFLDNVRKRCGKNIKHFIVAELGSDTERLHFHGILFGTSRESFPYIDILLSWKYGRVSLGYCNVKTCNYVVKYLCKQIGDGRMTDGMNRVICSHGIGAGYVTDYIKLQHRKEMNYTIMYGNRFYYMSRYLSERIFNFDDKVWRLNNPLPMNPLDVNGFHCQTYDQARNVYFRLRQNDKTHNQWQLIQSQKASLLKSSMLATISAVQGDLQLLSE